MTRLVYFDQGGVPQKVSEEEILQAFTRSQEHIYFENLGRIASIYKKRLVAVLLPECPTHQIKNNTPCWVISTNENGKLRTKTLTVTDLRTAIRNNRGGPAGMGTKGLTYGTSAVECFLSKTEDIFPGDVDSIVTDEDNHIRFVIEFKKHTIPDPIAVHLADRYYGSRDKRKYQALNALVTEINSANMVNVPLVILYYRTKNPYGIRLQKVGKLTPLAMETNYDSGDISTQEMTDQEIAQTIARKLNIPR